MCTAASHDSNNRPPVYTEDAHPQPDDSHVIVPPGTLYAAERFIYAGDAQSPPLYELSHNIGFLRDTDRTVSLRRLERSVKQARGREPRVVERKRSIYELKHPAPATWPTVPFHAEPSSRQALCKLGLETFRARQRLSGTRCFRISRAVRNAPAAPRSSKLFPSLPLRVHRDGRGVTNSLALMDEIFTAVPPRDKKSTFEWRNQDDNVIAREVVSQGLLSLVVTSEMSVVMRDALVASWIMRVWSDMAGSNMRIANWLRNRLFTTD